MAKLTLTNLDSLANEATAKATINNNSTAIVAALENTLSRDGTAPNTMSADFDMNSNRILNLPEPVADTEPVRLIDVGNATAAASAAAASATAAASSASAASTSASSASTSASSASTSATAAAASAATSAANATVVVGDEYAFDTSTTMADPGTGDLRLDNATVASATNIAISALTNASGNPNIRTFIASWDDITNATARGTLTLRKIGTPATFAVFRITGALTDNTTWLQLAVTHVTSSGTWSAADRVSVQFDRSGQDGAGTITGSTGGTDNAVLRADGTGGSTVQASAVTIDDSGNVAGVATLTTTGAIELGHASDTTISRTGAGAIAVEGVGVALNSASLPHTASQIELGHASDTTLTRTAAGQIAVEGTAVALAGKQTIWIPAGAMTTRTTNGAAAGLTEMTTNKNMLKTLDFDTTTQEFVQFEVFFPKSWNLGTVTFQALWSHAATATNFGVVWGLAGVARSDDDAGDVAFGTAQTSTDTGGTTNDIYVSPESSAITIAGTPAAGDSVQFQLNRTVADGGDTMAIDARLHGIRLFFTTNAATDA